ncbi:MAG: DUF4760 domain-containing protein [Clostridia bacterium]|nr:DUF4760 domain-containing protein [Clostridia bacterium]
MWNAIENLVDWFALIVALFALALSVLQFIKDSSRQKKESTLNAYSELQHDVFDKLNNTEYEISEVEFDSVEWKEITGYLAKIERFSVGINTGIYSIEVLNRLGGSYFLFRFNELKPIIEIKEKNNEVDGKHYDEFQKTAKRLKEYRECKNDFERLYKRMTWLIKN